MEKDFQELIQTRLQDKRKNLETWLETETQEEKCCRLENSGEPAVVEQLIVLDHTLGKLEDESLGVCSVCHGHIEESVLAVDYTASFCLDCLSEEQRRQLEAELEFSSEIQRALLPNEAPAIPGLDIAVYSRPAQIIGGDYFDFFRFKDGSYGVVVADVVGHGFAAGLLMSSLQTAVHTLTSDNISVTDLIRRINQYFLHNINLTTFITLFLGQYDPARQVLTYCNAGHNPPILFRWQVSGKDPISLLKPTAAAVGLVDDYKVRSEQLMLQPEDLLLIYTDGVTEAANPRGEEFGLERLKELIVQNAGLPAQALVPAVRKGLELFLAGKHPADDLTIVAGRALEL
jgi:phosphoserine phosphatase RsbU/P